MAEITSKPAAKAPAKKAPAKASAAKSAPVAVGKPVAKSAAVSAAANGKKVAAAPKKAQAEVGKSAAKAAAKSLTPPLAKSGGKSMVVSDEQRYRMVAEAAYYRAESNHFKSDPLRDWIEAESDIAALLSGLNPQR